MTPIRLTAAQAMVRFPERSAGRNRWAQAALFQGVFAIFGHGNVAAHGSKRSSLLRDALPTYRAHNEQAMALTAVAFAKASRRSG